MKSIRYLIILSFAVLGFFGYQAVSAAQTGSQKIDKSKPGQDLRDVQENAPGTFDGSGKRQTPVKVEPSQTKPKTAKQIADEENAKERERRSKVKTGLDKGVVPSPTGKPQTKTGDTKPGVSTTRTPSTSSTAVKPSTGTVSGSPPATRPTVTTPPVTRPAVTSPPPTRPPVVTSPPTRPPMITTPPTRPPVVTSPPVTRPPVTSPPATRPPTTSPPATSPPAKK